MNKKTLKVLEYDKIIEMLREKVESSLGKKLVENLEPFKDKQVIEKKQIETSEALSILINLGEPPLYGIYDIKEFVSRAQIGAILYPESLIKISDLIRVVSDFKEFNKKIIDNERIEADIIPGKIDQLSLLKDLQKAIDRVVVNENEIADNASSELKNIRSKIKSKNDKIRSKLDSIINSNKYDKVLQDKIVTVRGGRYVVPVKQASRKFFPGLVHDQSASGSTLFIEPVSVVELNNELKQLEIEEKKEIERILVYLSKIVAEKALELISNQNILQELDFIFAKGKLALEMNGTRPILNLERKLNLKQAKHPLLDKKQVVPIDVSLGEDFNTLVITGPNTGGKTVTLKTVGLLTLMAQSGLHIPADSNSKIGIFDEIYADIGDEQSIEQSLSTFSSHMTNIVEILENVNSRSLVLFDELGAGTDPTEGAALAMSILDNLLEKNIRTMATTHYSQLKLYALTKEGVVNGSVEFDVETLSPTYRLLIGVPGKSNAFEISKRLGLQDYIIDEAKDLVSTDAVEFEDVLTAIDRDRRTIEEDKYETERLKEQVKKLKEELENEKDRTKKSRENILKKAKEEARDILRMAKLESTHILSEIKDISHEIDREKRRKLEQAQAQLKDGITSLESELSENVLNVRSKEIPSNLKVGETVEVLSLSQTGTVLTQPDDSGNLDVQVGIMKVSVNIKSLVRAEDEEEKKSYSSTKRVIKSKINVKKEIDLRGMNLDEALLELAKYIDDIYLAKVKEAQIIHGKGTGVLRSGIRSYLKNNPYIKDYREGKFNEGGTGVTVITLK